MVTGVAQSAEFGKNLGHAVYLVDRSAGTTTVADLKSTDAMEAFLASVPAEQP